MFPFNIPKTYVWPDGTKSTTRPRDGETWTKFDSQQNPIEKWQWDGHLEQWFNVSSGRPTPHNTKTFVVPPIDLGAIELDDSGEWKISSNERITLEPWKEPKCDCGSHAVGSPKHSSWCSVYTPDT